MNDTSISNLSDDLPEI